MRHCTFTLLAPLLMLAAGCQVDQEKEVAEYRKLVDLPPATQPVLTGPLTLRQALLLANQQNERLSIEGENYLQALINRQRAVAGFLPTVNLSPSYFRRDATGSSTSNSNTAGGSSAQTSGLDVSVVGDINLFNGFADVARLRASDLTIEQRRALLLDAQEALLADVVRVFFDVLRNEELIRVLENSLKVQDERVRDIRGRQAAGVARPLDVAQTEAQASSTRVTLVDARNAVRNGRAALAFLVGSPVMQLPLVDAYLLPEAIVPLESLHSIAQKQRQDLIGAQQAVLASRQQVEAAFRQYYPSVSLNLEGFLYRETIPDARRWEALLSANVPIFAAGRIQADVREAWSLYRQAGLFSSQLSRQVFRETEQAYQNLVSSEQRLAELQTQVAAARAAFEQAEASYNVGLATNLERVVAQDRLLSAELDLAGEQFTRKIAYLDLLRAIGGLREELETRATTMPTTRAATQPAAVPATQPLVAAD